MKMRVFVKLVIAIYNIMVITRNSKFLIPEIAIQKMKISSPDPPFRI